MNILYIPIEDSERDRKEGLVRIFDDAFCNHLNIIPPSARFTLKVSLAHTPMTRN